MGILKDLDCETVYAFMMTIHDKKTANNLIKPHMEPLQIYIIRANQEILLDFVSLNNFFDNVDL